MKLLSILLVEVILVVGLYVAANRYRMSFGNIELPSATTTNLNIDKEIEINNCKHNLKLNVKELEVVNQRLGIFRTDISKQLKAKDLSLSLDLTYRPDNPTSRPSKEAMDEWLNIPNNDLDIDLGLGNVFSISIYNFNCRLSEMGQEYLLVSCNRANINNDDFISLESNITVSFQGQIIKANRAKWDISTSTIYIERCCVMKQNTQNNYRKNLKVQYGRIK